MFLLVARTLLAVLARACISHLRARGHAKHCMQGLVVDSEAAKDAVAFTQKVLDLREKHTRIIQEAFNSDRLFVQALNASFEVCPLA
jgi:hypothetical protein